MSQRRDELAELTDEINHFAAAAAWHETYDAPRKQALLEALQIESIEMASRVATANAGLLKVDESVSLLRVEQTRLEPGWNILARLFDSERSKQHDDVTRTIREKESLATLIRGDLERLEKDRADLDGRRENLHSELRRYASFDASSNRQILSELKGRRRELAAELKVLEARQRSLQRRLEPLKDALAKAKQEHSRMKKSRRLAERLIEGLAGSSNSYERKRLHDQSREAVADSNPSRALNHLDFEIRSIERTINKIRSRIDQIEATARLHIDTVVVDGNNLLYAGDQFVGDAFLACACRELSKSYRVIVIFDNSVMSVLKQSDYQVRHLLPKASEVRICPVGASADSTILRLASNSGVAVMSNDRFSDYPEMAAVRGKRILPFTIAGGRIICEALDLDASPSPDPIPTTRPSPN